MINWIGSSLAAGIVLVGTVLLMFVIVTELGWAGFVLVVGAAVVGAWAVVRLIDNVL